MKPFGLFIASFFISILLFSQGSSIVFDGSTRIDCSENAVSLNTTTFSQEAWIYVENVSKTYQLIMGIEWNNNSAADRPPSLYTFNTTGLHFGFGDGSSWYSTDLSGDYLTLNAWNHCALTFDGTNYNCYINGEEVFSGTFAAGQTPGDFPLRGIGASNTSNYFNGKIDEVRVWNIVRNLDEIREFMYREIPEPNSQTGLISYFKMNEESGNSTANEINGVSAGTLIGGTGWEDSEAFNTWVGSTSNSWGDATNWSRGAIPVANDNVGIYEGTTNDPFVNNLEVVVNQVIMGQNTTLTIDPESIFTAINFFSNTTDPITVDGDLDVTNTLQLSGNIDGEGIVFASNYELADGVTVYGLTPADGERAAGGTWEGGTDSDWFNGTNWNRGSSPAGNTSVLIDINNAPGNMPILDGNTADCKSITIVGTGSSLKIESTGQLNTVKKGKNGYIEIIQGSVTVDGGVLTANTNFDVDQGVVNVINTGSIQVVGNVTVKTGSTVNLQSGGSLDIGQ